jgi:DNA-binding IclR family transcriptional regulator
VVEISLTGDQMLAVLETVARHAPVTVSDVARLCDINRTVAHRLLATLSQRAYVRKEGSAYVMGPAILGLALQTDTDLRSVAKPVMQRLAQDLGETVVLHGIDKLEAVVLDQVLGQQHLLRVEHTPGSRHPLHLGASGWSILAFQPPKTIDKIVKKFTDVGALLTRIEQVRNDGYCVSHDELQRGVHGVAAPILEKSGRCLASIAVVVPAARAEIVPSLVKPVLAAARDIAAGLS